MAWTQSVKDMNSITRKLRKRGFTVEFEEGQHFDFLHVSRADGRFVTHAVVEAAQRAVCKGSKTLVKLRAATSNESGRITLRIVPA